MRAVLLIVAFILSGCSPDSKELKKEKTEFRLSIFKECMNAASKQNNGVQSAVESEVSNTVDSCDSFAYYMTNARF
jgi:PBP1b-binding outer membrane lipoprotein LpoB